VILAALVRAPYDQGQSAGCDRISIRPLRPLIRLVARSYGLHLLRLRPDIAAAQAADGHGLASRGFVT